jgi:hypothetical protein
MKRLPFALLALLMAVPMFGRAISHDVTLPVAGKILLPGDIAYITQLTITNHRDATQQVAIQWIDAGSNDRIYLTTLGPKETYFLPGGREYVFYGGDSNSPGALRFIAATNFSDKGDATFKVDPNGRLEISATIVKLRGRFGFDGSSRQEVEGVPASEYLEKEATFVGVRHEEPAYCNVGVVNLSSTETVTFTIEYSRHEPLHITVAPQSNAQVRIPSPGGDAVRVYPEWAGSGRTPTPWVAYASVVDGYTGDAFSGVRVPPGSKFRP